MGFIYSQLKPPEVLRVQEIQDLANSGANEALAKTLGSVVNKEVSGGGGGGAPTGASYLTATAEAGLSAEVNLGALATGLLKGTVAGGVSTISAITDNSSNWNTAYGWGNHAGLYATAAQGSTADAALPSASFTATAVTDKLITGFVSGAGAVAATDTILRAINKLDGNVALKAPLTAPTFATSITGSYLTASEILITDASKNIVSAPVATYPSLVELAFLKGTSSAIQTQLGGKAATGQTFYIGTTQVAIDRASAALTLAGITLTAPTFATSITGSYLTASEILITDASKNIVSAPVATYPSLVELAFLKGTSSAIQTQLGGKAATGQTFYIGTTQVAIDRASAALTLAGITLTTPDIGTPSAGTLTNCTGLPIAGLTASTSTALGVGSIELGHATDTTISRSGAGVIAVENVVIPSISSTNTLTNKRITPRILSAASYTTDTGTSLNCDNLDEFIVTAQEGSLKLNNPTGTPTNGQILFVAITGTAARALTYDTQFEASTTALPTTTITTARLNMIFVWRADTSKWVILASS